MDSDAGGALPFAEFRGATALDIAAAGLDERAAMREAASLWARGRTTATFRAQNEGKYELQKEKKQKNKLFFSEH